MGAPQYAAIPFGNLYSFGMVEQALASLGLTAMPRLSDFIEDIFLPAKRGLAGSTLRGYRRDINLRIVPMLGDRLLDEIIPPLIQEMIYSCPTRGSAQNARDTLSAILGFAVESRVLFWNPAAAKYIYPDAIQAIPQYRATTFDEIAAWLKFARDTVPNSDIERTLILGMCFGLRPGEIFGTDAEYIDLSKEILYVRQSYTYGDGCWELGSPKTPGSNRDLPVFRYAHERMAELGVWRGPWVQNCYGERACPSTVREHLTQWRKKYGLPDITVFTLRHSFAMAALDAGVSIADLAAWLGHTNTETTARFYLKPNYMKLVKHAKMLSPLLSLKIAQAAMPGSQAKNLNFVEGSQEWRLLREIELEDTNFNHDPINDHLIDPKGDPKAQAVLDMTPMRREALSFLSRNPKASLKETARYLGVSEATVKRSIQTLKSSGVLMHEGSKRAGVWRVMA